MRTLSSAEAATVGGGTGGYVEAVALATTVAAAIEGLFRALHDAEETGVLCEEGWCVAATPKPLAVSFLA